jgi:hypothetical protein
MHSAFQRILLLTCTLILAFTASNQVLSQKIVSSANKGEDIFIARVKQFNEFADRFNLKSDFNGNPADSVFRAKMPREKMIPLLFDLGDTEASINKSSSKRKDIVRMRNDFITNVCREKLILNKYSPGIIAEARSRVLIDDKPYTIRVFLNQEIVGDDMVKWVILTVKGEFFNFFKPDSTMIRFISPTSNETDFINLKRALEDSDYLHYYASKDFKPDYLTLFFYLIRSGQVKFEYVEEVVYHIIDIPGWYFQVKEFNRNNLNSGWLISDVARNNLNLPEFLITL